MVPALFFGYALNKTGLGKRIAYWLLRRIRIVTYPKLILCWALLGFLLSVFTPSIMIRVILVMPLTLECAQICGIPRQSRGDHCYCCLPGHDNHSSIGCTGSLMGPI